MLTKYSDAMAKRDPFDGLWRTTENMFKSDIFEDLFANALPRTERSSYRVEHNESEMIASFDLPGVKPGDIEISAVDQKLTISYTLRGKKHTQDYTIHHDYDVAAASAKIEHGVLEVRFPRITRIKGKKIAIEVK